ncbi:MAG TPA: hypothetical protein VFN88_01560, partial [Caulobacteraceae bacterium]|nr:hypothetical protein [Caulobacteraceae bacterium]
HGLVLFALYNAHVAAPPLNPEPPPVMAELIKWEPPPPQEPTEAPAPKVAPKPTPVRPKRTIRKAPPTKEVAPAPAVAGPVTQMAVEVSDSDLVGAATAGSGGSGGGCNMVRLLQAALRRDARIQAAVAEAHRTGTGRAMLVWNGDWVRHPTQDGLGLAQIKEAILVEVGFAPAACKTEPVHGMVVISLSDAPGSPRLALGGGSWRWSDLLFARGTARG